MEFSFLLLILCCGCQITWTFHNLIWERFKSILDSWGMMLLKLLHGLVWCAHSCKGISIRSLHMGFIRYWSNYTLGFDIWFVSIFVKFGGWSYWLISFFELLSLLCWSISMVTVDWEVCNTTTFIFYMLARFHNFGWSLLFRLLFHRTVLDAVLFINLEVIQQLRIIWKPKLI